MWLCEAINYDKGNDCVSIVSTKIAKRRSGANAVSPLELTCKTAHNADDAGKAKEAQWEEIEGHQNKSTHDLPLCAGQDTLEKQLHGVGEKDQESNTGREQFQGEQYTRGNSRVSSEGNVG